MATVIKFDDHSYETVAKTLMNLELSKACNNVLEELGGTTPHARAPTPPQFSLRPRLPPPPYIRGKCKKEPYWALILPH